MTDYGSAPAALSAATVERHLQHDPRLRQVGLSDPYDVVDHELGYGGTIRVTHGGYQCVSYRSCFSFLQYSSMTAIPSGENQLGELCCEDFYCRALDDSEVRASGQNVYVKIGKEWCEVEPQHYVRGTSPDWSHAHMCLAPGTGYPPIRRPNCERIICFMPKPDF